jgi:hypothetical protein
MPSFFFLPPLVHSPQPKQLEPNMASHLTCAYHTQHTASDLRLVKPHIASPTGRALTTEPPSLWRWCCLAVCARGAMRNAKSARSHVHHADPHLRPPPTDQYTPPTGACCVACCLLAMPAEFSSAHRPRMPIARILPSLVGTRYTHNKEFKHAGHVGDLADN